MRCPQPIKGWALPCPFLSLLLPWYPQHNPLVGGCDVFRVHPFLYKSIQILPLGTRLQFAYEGSPYCGASRKARLWRDELPKPKTGNRIQNSRIFALSTFFVSK